MITTNISKVNYLGNGTTTVFPFSFKVWKSENLKVQITDSDGLIETVDNYTATITEDGGQISYLLNGSPLPTGYTLTILRDMPFEQDVDLITGTRFDPEVIETALDKATAERQQILEVAQRAVVVPPSSSLSSEEFANELFSARNEAVAKAEESAQSAQQAKDFLNSGITELETNKQQAISDIEAKTLDSENRLQVQVDEATNQAQIATTKAQESSNSEINAKASEEQAKQYAESAAQAGSIASDETYELGLSTTQSTNPKQVKGDINRLENSLSNLDRVSEDFTVPRSLNVGEHATVNGNLNAGGVIATNFLSNNNVRTKTLTLDDYMNVPFDGINMKPIPSTASGTAILQLQNASDINGVTGQRFDVDVVVDGAIVKSLFGVSDTYGLWISKTGKWVVPENPPTFVGNANKWALKFHNGFIIQGGNESTSTTTINFLIPFTSTTYVTNLGFTIDGLASQIVTKSTTKMDTGATIRASFMHNWLAMGY